MTRAPGWAGEALGPAWLAGGGVRSLWLAIQFLTVAPVRVAGPVSPTALGRSLAWYPLVGAGLGVVVGGAAVLLRGSGAPEALAAALAITLALTVTGALHLDGLLDTADGVFSARPPVARLAIMTDPRIGTYGLAAGACILLIKVAALAALPLERLLPTCVAALALSRAVMVGAAVLAPAAKPTGLGTRMTEAAGRRELWLAATSGLLIAIIAAGAGGVVWAGVAGLVGWLGTRWLVARLGGLTGDGYGALNEIIEALVLGLASWRGLPL